VNEIRERWKLGRGTKEQKISHKVTKPLRNRKFKQKLAKAAKE
jgi:hypothetical protein